MPPQIKPSSELRSGFLLTLCSAVDTWWLKGQQEHPWDGKEPWDKGNGPAGLAATGEHPQGMVHATPGSPFLHQRHQSCNLISIPAYSKWSWEINLTIQAPPLKPGKPRAAVNMNTPFRAVPPSPTERQYKAVVSRWQQSYNQHTREAISSQSSFPLGNVTRAWSVFFTVMSFPVGNPRWDPRGQWRARRARCHRSL